MDNYYTIRDVSSLIGIREHLLRQWEVSLGLQVDRDIDLQLKNGLLKKRNGSPYFS